MSDVAPEVGRPLLDELPVRPCGVLGGGSVAVMRSAADVHRAVVGFGDGRVVVIDSRSAARIAELPAHKSAVGAVAISRDGSLVASAAGTAIQVARADDGKVLLALPGHTDDVVRLAFAPNNGALVSVGNREALRLWRLNDGQPLWSLPQSDFVRFAQFAADGATIMVSVGLRLLSLTVSVGEMTGELRLNGEVREASADGRLVAGESARGLEVWEAATGTRITDVAIVKYPTLVGGDMAISHDGAQVAWLSPQNELRVFQVTGEAVGRWVSSARPTAVSYDLGGDVILVGDERGAVRALSTKSLMVGNMNESVPGPSRKIDQIMFSPDGARLASRGGELLVWQVGDSTPSITVTAAGPERFGPFAFSTDSATLATVIGTLAPDGASSQSRVVVRSAATGTIVGSFDVGDGAVAALAFTPDAATLVTASSDGIRGWQRASAAQGWTIAWMSKPDPPVTALAFLEDGALLAGFPLRQWADYRLDAAPAWSFNIDVGSFVLSPSGDRIVATLVDPPDNPTSTVVVDRDSATAVLVDREGRLMRTLQSPTAGPASAATYSPSGDWIALAGNGGIHLFRASDGRLVGSIPGEFTSLQFSPKDDRLAAVSSEVVRMFCDVERAADERLMGETRRPN